MIRDAEQRVLCSITHVCYARCGASLYPRAASRALRVPCPWAHMACPLALSGSPCVHALSPLPLCTAVPLPAALPLIRRMPTRTCAENFDEAPPQDEFIATNGLLYCTCTCMLCGRALAVVHVVRACSWSRRAPPRGPRLQLLHLLSLVILCHPRLLPLLPIFWPCPRFA